MSNWGNVSFKVIKKTDEAAFAALKDSAVGAKRKIIQISFEWVVGGDSLTFNYNPDADNGVLPDEVKNTFSEQSCLIKTFRLTFDDGTATVLRRDIAEVFDNVSMELGNLVNQPNRANRPQLAKFHKLLRETFTPLDVSPLKAGAGDRPELQRHYEIREAELSRLESMIARMTTEVTNEALRVRKSLEEEYRKRNEELSAQIQEMRNSLEVEYSKRAEGLAKTEAELRGKLKEIDDKESRYARRGLRKDLKEELAKRGEKFELTRGTRNLRWPINIFALLLLLGFGVGFGVYLYLGVKELSAIPAGQSILTPLFVASTIKQLAFGVAFASTSVFFIRWNTKWFQAHADEEFRQKRFDLDLDRASWIVEMAMEWKEDKGTEIPAELLGRLSANLFSEATPKEEKLHPADQLASAILGASAETSVELPGGTKVRLDRKSMKELSKGQ